MFSRIFIYKFFSQNGSKVLSAWMSFVVRGVIKQIQFIDSDLYIVTAYNGQIQLEKINLSEGEKDAEGRITYLDHRVLYNITSTTSNFSVDLPYTPSSDDDVQAVTAEGEELNISVNGNTVSLPDGIKGKVYIGLKYTMTYILSEQRFAAPSSQNKLASNASKLSIKNANLFYFESSNFKFIVNPEFKQSSSTELNVPRVVPSVVALDSGVLRCPVHAKGRDTELIIQNDTPFPSNIQNIEFESFVHPRSSRYG